MTATGRDNTMDIAQWSTNRLLNTAARLSANRENERLRRLGTTHAGLLTLKVLGRRNSINQVELARELHVQAQTIGKLLERLENRGLIERTKSADDRRVFFVSLTPAGEQILKRAQAMEEEQGSNHEASDAILRRELIAHIRDLGGSPGDRGARPNLRTVDHGATDNNDVTEQDLTEQNLTAG